MPEHSSRPIVAIHPAFAAWQRTLFALAALCLPAAAQSVRVECVSFPKAEPAKVEVLVAPDKTIELTLQSHALTEPVQLPPMPVWRFGKGEVDDSGQFRFTSYGEVKPLDSPRQLLVFLRKGKEPKDGLVVLPLDGRRKGFGERDMFFANLSRRTVAGLVGGKRFVLPPGRHTIVQPAADRGEGLCHASLRYQQGEDWRTFFSSNWPVLKQARGLVFLHDDPRSKSIVLHSIVDSLRELPAADNQG